MTAHPEPLPAPAILAGCMLATAILLGGCSEPAFRTDPASAAAHTVKADALAGLPEPGPREIVVVINGNAYKGVHAGMFAGSRLYDPSGTYTRARSEDRSWRHATLADYLAYQLADGPDVRVYRFELSEADFATILARIGHAGWTLPTDCANSVRDALAGVGPFRSLEIDGWISPKRLAAKLDPLAVAVQAKTPAQPPLNTARPASQAPAYMPVP
ncbi:MAG: hypothetical protein WC474_14300 [Hydrogenophilaceae bacterium]